MDCIASAVILGMAIMLQWLLSLPVDIGVIGAAKRSLQLGFIEPMRQQLSALKGKEWVFISLTVAFALGGYKVTPVEADLKALFYAIAFTCFLVGIILWPSKHTT